MGVRIQVGLIQGDDVGVGTYLGQHLDLSLGRERIGSGQHERKSDMPPSFRIPGQVCLFARAFPDQMIDSVAPHEKRALGKSWLNR